MSYIGTKTGSQVFVPSTFESRTFIANGTIIQYDLGINIVNDASIIVHIDGVKQHISAYSTAGTQLIFTEEPANGSDIEVIIFGIGSVDVYTPTANSVGAVALNTNESNGTLGQVLTTDGAGNLSWGDSNIDALAALEEIEILALAGL
jgi:hypothetical protein